jgi:hypothetical protein
MAGQADRHEQKFLDPSGIGFAFHGAPIAGCPLRYHRHD